MELQLEDLEATATEDELAAEQAARRYADGPLVRAQAAVAQAVPRHLPRERVVIAAPDLLPAAARAGSSKLGEDITETLEVIPRQWKVIQTVREKFSCRDCETITQPPAPFHVTPRGFAGPNLLAMILFEKFGQHQPLNRQSERYAREGIDLSVSTLADQVGACTTALQPLHALIEAHVLAAERLHGDDTTVPILAKGKTDHGPTSGPMSATIGPSAAAHRRRRCSTPRATGGSDHPERHLRRLRRHPAGRCLCRLQRALRAIPLAGTDHGGALLGHARRKFFELADIAANARRGKNAPPISPSRWRPSSASMCCSTSSATSTA